MRINRVLALAKKPSLKVLHNSGFTSAARQDMPGWKRLLSKPYRKGALPIAVRESWGTPADEKFGA